MALALFLYLYPFSGYLATPHLDLSTQLLILTLLLALSIILLIVKPSDVSNQTGVQQMN